MRRVVIILLLCITIVGATSAQKPRAPTFRYTRTEGCGGVIVAGLSADGSEGLVVFADSRAVGLAERRKTFDLSEESNDVRVRVHLFRKPRRGEVYCTDAGGLFERDPDPLVGESWRAVKGELTILLHSAQGEAGTTSYAAIVSLENVVFAAPDGRVAEAPRELALRARLVEVG